MLSKIPSILLALLSGLFLGFSWPASGSITPFIFIGFVPLLLLEQQISSNQKTGSIFRLSYFTFFVFNLITTWWIYCVDEDLITKLISIGTPLLLNPLFMASSFWGYGKIKKLLGPKKGYWGLLILWVAFEYTHLNWSISDPWLTLGNVFANRPSWIQWYEYTGTLGGSLWVLLINLFVFLTIVAVLQKQNRKTIVKYVTILLVVFVAPIVYSISTYHNYQEHIDPIEVTIVQPNIDPYNYKFTGSANDQIQAFLDLAESNVSETTNYVLGPETALPYSIWIDKLSESPMHELLKTFNGRHLNTDLILGASLGEVYHSASEITSTARKFNKVDKWYDYYNSAIQVDQSDSIQIYHKSKLVLGVESMPFPQLFMHFQDVIFDLGGTTGSLGVQKERDVFYSSTSSHKIAPVICWESVYGEHVGEYIRKGADAIFILTNDGWWAETAGYKQHCEYARLRAIETRRSIARSANTGTSCFINQQGDIIKSTDWWTATTINDTINANNELTFYTIYGDFIGRVSALFAGLLLLWAFVKQYSTVKPTAT